MEIGRGAMWTAHPVEVRPMSYQSPSSLTTEYVPNRIEDVAPYFQLKRKRPWLVDILYKNSTTYEVVKKASN